MADKITPESQVDSHMIPPLDPELLTLSERELEFLHAVISSDEAELKRRVLEVQKKAYEKYPYPCIRAFHYVNLMMSANPVYAEVVKAGKRGDTLFLDLGCCMGTDIRKLAYDGYPAEHILGCDIREEYIELGRKLYKDADKTPIRFFTSDIFSLPVSFSPSSTRSLELGQKIENLAQLTGRVTHVYTGALFHLFDEPTQYALALRLAGLLKRERGAIVFGRHQGLEEEGLIDDHLGRVRYGHSPKSWLQLWKNVFTEAENEEFAEKRVTVEAKLTEGFDGKIFRAPGRNHMLVWSVTIV